MPIGYLKRISNIDVGNNRIDVNVGAGGYKQNRDSGGVQGRAHNREALVSQQNTTWGEGWTLRAVGQTIGFCRLSARVLYPARAAREGHGLFHLLAVDEPYKMRRGGAIAKPRVSLLQRWADHQDRDWWGLLGRDKA